MECKEILVDLKNLTEEERKASAHLHELVKKLNASEVGSAEYKELVKEIFHGNVDENIRLPLPLKGAAFDHLKIGKNAVLGADLLFMARGGITIEDDVMIAANAQIISNNHDPYDRWVLPCKPVLIQKGAWIGAGATVLPGVSIGKYAIVGAASVVTKDIPDYGVAVGNPAKVIRMLDPEKFPEE